MRLEDMPLARQVDYVFRQLEEELIGAVAGTVTVLIRNNTVGKYGVRHHPIESRNGQFGESAEGMSAQQVSEFRRLAVDALRLRANWTHGEIAYDFAVKRGKEWSASVQYESNYNTANWMFRYQPKRSSSDRYA